MQKLLQQDDSIKLLHKYGIETPIQKVALGLKDVIAVAQAAGFPIFLKVSSQEISHKTDLGLVGRANSVKEASSEFQRILEASQKITKNIDGVLVQEFIEGPEFIMGIKTDPTFGKVIMFGSGGIYTEIFKDVSFRLCPIDEKEALKMMEETKAYKMMHARGKNINEKKIAKILSALSDLAIKENVNGIDINPFIAGKKYVAADVKILR